jgi:predicted dehydrogenase
MDYTQSPLGFKVKKALRYVRLYGPRRTWVKIRAQYRMGRRFTRLPDVLQPPPAGGHVGLIGCGSFGFSTIAYYLHRNYGKVIRGCMDIDVHRAASLYRTYGLRYYTDDADRVIGDPEIDLVFIASNHASHAEYAIRALEAGKAVHIEKPHCVTESQLRRLCHTMERTGGKVALGFNRPGSRIGEEILRALGEQGGEAMFNWFIVGHQIDPDHWYFREEEGGLVLGNLCHWTDFVLQMVPPEERFPIRIQAIRAARSDTDIVVSYVFGDGSLAAITFSAKGPTFEGVRERFAAQKGDLLVAMDDFRTLTLEVRERKSTIHQRFRDHGHERRVRSSYAMAKGGEGEPVHYVWETGLLFLKTREALEAHEPRVVEGFEKSYRRED